jgi:hypothetical protein
MPRCCNASESVEGKDLIVDKGSQSSLHLILFLDISRIALAVFREAFEHPRSPLSAVTVLLSNAG